MTRSFPTNFSPDLITGPRASQYAEREDAFQQLIGDALREEWGSNVFVAPTKGRDGSIDAFVTGSSDAFASVHGVPVPAIIECKDHDDQLPRVGDNITAGWSAVARKLLEQASNGWPGLYRPWRTARGYVYCVSAVLPNEQTRRELEAQIQAFFQSLPDDQRPPIEKVQVVGWASVRDWLDRIPRVADRWLGVGLPALAAHEEYVASLQGFRELLLDDRLSFVAPPPQAPYHPDRLLEHAIGLANQKGVLLVGPGGVGKTRTLMEVATRANASGWRVLHALPGEPALTTEQLADVVLQGNDSTLVLIDYLDQMRLDLGSIRRRLLPEMQRRGAALILVADARPAFELRASADWPILFERVELRPSDSHSREISLHAQATMAPQAIRILGPSRVAFLCGTRPTIALLIARELERRAHEGSLTPELVIDVRSGDLITWLRRRLAEDHLTVTPPPSILQQAQPSDELIAAAAILAASPQKAEKLQEVAEKALTTQAAWPAGTAGSGRGSFLINVLRNLGWLEWRGLDLAVAHDLVADEVLEQAVSASAIGGVRRDVIRRILNAGLTAPRTLGRYAVSLTRLIRHADAGGQGDMERSLQEVAGEWFTDEAQAIGRRLLAADPDESSYALGAVLAGPPWADAIVVCWQEIAQPWLQRHQTAKEARHLLYRGLRVLKGEPAKALVDTANEWLLERDRDLEATFVLGPLLKRADLEPGAAHMAIAHAFGWLATHGTTLEAPFVLYPLLGRRDLDAVTAQKAIAHALSWLAAIGTTSDVRFVLQPLLDRGDLEFEAAQKAIAHALGWLAATGTTSDVRFVLRPLLDRSDLDAEAAQKAVAHSLSWLAANDTILDTQFVLHSLLGRGDLEAKAAQNAIARALSWFATYGTTLEAEYVLGPLLGRGDLDVKTAQTAVANALTWLSFEERDGILAADHLIRSVLGRDDLAVASVQSTIEHALRWLTNNAMSVEADFILLSLLKRSDLDVHAAQKVIVHALSWLSIEERSVAATADYVIRGVLGRNDLSADSARRAIEFAQEWLEAADHLSHDDADYLIGWLLARPDLDPLSAEKAVKHAFTWLAVEKHRTSPGASFVLRPLLARTDLDRGTQARATDEALSWLDSHAARPEASFLLQRCLKNRYLTDEQVDRLARAMHTWTFANSNHPDMTYVVNAFLRQPRASQLLPYALALAVTWLRANPIRHDRDFTMNSLLMHWRLLGSDDLQHVVTEAITWLRERRRAAHPGANLLQHLNDVVLDPTLASLRNEIVELANEYGVALDDQKATKPFRELTAELDLFASASEHVSLQFLREALDATRRKVRGGGSASASWALPALLTLTARSGDAVLFEATKALTANVMETLTESQRVGLALGCRRLVESGAWPDAILARSTFESLGLQ